jgi:hypothetical protein
MSFFLVIFITRFPKDSRNNIKLSEFSGSKEKFNLKKRNNFILCYNFLEVPYYIEIMNDQLKGKLLTSHAT